MEIQNRPIQVGPPTHSWDHGDGYMLDLYVGAQYENSLPALRDVATELNKDVFGLSSIVAAEEIIHHVRRPSTKWMPSVILASKESKYIGASIQAFTRVPLLSEDGKGVVGAEPIVWTFLRIVEEGHQRRGIGTGFIQRVYETYMRNGPAYFVGRSRNPAVFLAYQRARDYGTGVPVALFDKIIGLDEEYQEGSVPHQILNFVTARSTHNNVLVDSRGVAKGIFAGEKLGYEPDLTNQGYLKIRDRLAQLGLVLEDGDAMTFAARLSSVSLARSRG